MTGQAEETNRPGQRLANSPGFREPAGMATDEWMRGASTASSMQGLIDLCNPNSLLAPLSASGVSGATRSVTMYHGQPALALTLPGTQQDPSPTGSIIVTDTPKPLLLDISEPGSGAFAFTGYEARTPGRQLAASIVRRLGDTGSSQRPRYPAWSSRMLAACLGMRIVHTWSIQLARALRAPQPFRE